MSTFKRVCVTNRRLARRDFLEQLELILSLPEDNRPDALILREKDLSTEDYQRVSDGVLSLCRRYGVCCIFNGHRDLAEQAGADGVQLSFSTYMESSVDNSVDIPLTGVSVHSLEEARAAAERGADYLIYGHVFATDCKPGLPPRGLAALAEICRAVSIPVYAIGGIDESNRELCLKAGAAGVCMMSGYMNMDKTFA